MAKSLSLIIFFLVFQYQHGVSRSQGTSCNEELIAYEYPQTLQSPNFPFNYTNNLHCVIHITSRAETAIELDFKTFDLEEEEDCANDVLVVYDGIDDGQRLIQHSCGPHFAWPHFPDAVKSTNNQITIVFITNNNKTGRGYDISFRTVEQQQSVFVLAAADRERLHVIRRHSALNFGLFPNGLKSPLAVDYDPVEKYVYYSDNVTNIIGRIHIDNRTTEILHRKQISYPFALRVDVVNRLLYWSDAGDAKIFVSNLEGTQRQTVISSGLHKPGAIVQEPNKGFIYWTDWGNPAKIEAAEGDGSNRKTVINTQISSPQGLAIDLQERALYWVDTLLDKLETANVNGFGRRTLAYFHERDPFALVLDDDGFFFTDEEHGWIELSDRNPSRSNGFRVYIGSIREPRGLTLRPSRDYGDTMPYVCPRADCNDLCLPKPNNNYVCSSVIPTVLYCPTNMTKIFPDNVVNWEQPIAISPKQLPITTTPSHMPGEEFSVGVHYISYKFEDTLCNRAYCNFTIYITVPHMIICPDNIYETVLRGVTEVAVTWIVPKDTEGRPATNSSHHPGETFPVGKTVVTYVADYDDIHEECQFSIFVTEIDAEGPVFLNCPDKIFKWARRGETRVFVSWDSIKLADTAHIIDENHWMDSGGYFNTDYVETVHLRARDKMDNVADCNFTVEIRVDDERPVITNCPEDIFISSPNDRVPVDWREPTATDNSGTVNITLKDGPSPGSTMHTGATNVTYLAQDPNGNSATCTFKVHVSKTDDRPPGGVDAQSSPKGTGEDDSLYMLLIFVGSAIAVLLLLILCALLLLSYRCRRKPAREVGEIQRTPSLPPDYNYAVAEPVNSISLGVTGGGVQYRVAVPDNEPLYDTAAVGLPPAYEEEKKVDLSDEKGIPPGYQ